MKYNIKFIKGSRLIAIGVIGIIVSTAVPAYLRINFNLDEKLMAGLIPSGTLLSFILAYFTSKRREILLVNDAGLLTKQHGLIKWDEINSLHLVDDIEHEIFTIRFKSKGKISIPSKINDSLNRNTFVEFRNDVEKRVSEEHKSNGEVTQHSYAYEGKSFRLLGYVCILAVLIVTPYAVFLCAKGEMSAQKFVTLIVLYTSALPMIAKVFRDELFGKTKKTGANKAQA